MTVDLIATGRALPECPGERDTGRADFNNARRVKQRAKVGPRETRSFRASLRSAEPAFVLIFGRQDCLFCRAAQYPAGRPA